MTRSFLNKRVRCGVLHSRAVLPTWAEGIFKRLREVCGPSNVFELELDEVTGSLNARLSPSVGAQPRRAIEYQALNLDFILNLQGAVLPEKILKTLPNGCWSFRFGRLQPGDANFGFDELWAGEFLQHVSLERTDQRVVYKSGRFKPFCIR